MKPINNLRGKNTVQYQEHVPVGFCFIIKCIHENIYPTKTVIYTAKNKNEDVGEIFVEMLEKELIPIYKMLKHVEKMIMTDEDMVNYPRAEHCYACKKNAINLKRTEEM